MPRTFAGMADGVCWIEDAFLLYHGDRTPPRRPLKQNGRRVLTPEALMKHTTDLPLPVPTKPVTFPDDPESPPDDPDDPEEPPPGGCDRNAPGDEEPPLVQELQRKMPLQRYEKIKATVATKADKHGYETYREDARESPIWTAEDVKIESHKIYGQPAVIALEMVGPPRRFDGLSSLSITLRPIMKGFAPDEPS